jgi:hypothetical protein
MWKLGLRPRNSQKTQKWDFPCSVSNVKPTQVSNGGTSKGIGNLNSVIEKADRLLELKLTSSQFHQIAPLTLLAISQLMFAFTGRNMFISMKSLWRHFKNSKTTRNAYLCLHVHTFQKYLNNKSKFSQNTLKK